MAKPSIESNGQQPEAARAAASEHAATSRDILPIPDAKHVGLTTYDAKDPDTAAGGPSTPMRDGSSTATTSWASTTT